MDDRQTPPAWVRDAIIGLGLGEADQVRLRGGFQSEVYLVEGNLSLPLAIKRFRGDLFRQAEVEFGLLSMLGEALSGPASIGSPKAIAILPRQFGAGYIMSLVEGVPILEKDQAVECYGPQGSAIIDGLRCYHRAAGKSYGDFHFRNILAGDSGLYFIDPGSPSARHDRVEEDLLHGLADLPEDMKLLSIDLGYWLYSHISSLIYLDRKHLFLRSRASRLTEELLGRATALGADRSVIIRSAATHLDHPRSRRRLLNAPMRAILRQIFSRMDKNAREDFLPQV